VIVNDSGTEQLQEQVDRVIAWLKSMPE
jgi:hypothetical protein